MSQIEVLEAQENIGRYVKLCIHIDLSEQTIPLFDLTVDYSALDDDPQTITFAADLADGDAS